MVGQAKPGQPHQAAWAACTTAARPVVAFPHAVRILAWPAWPTSCAHPAHMARVPAQRLGLSHIVRSPRPACCRTTPALYGWPQVDRVY